MDNRAIDITSEGEAALALALRLAWPNAAGGKVSHVKAVNLIEKVTYYGAPTDRHITESREAQEGTKTLILLWHEERGSLPLAYPLDIEEAIPFVIGWLKRADRGPQPDHDGDNGKGWRVFTDSWGHVAGHQYTIAAVQPIWAVYGK